MGWTGEVAATGVADMTALLVTLAVIGVAGTYGVFIGTDETGAGWAWHAVSRRNNSKAKFIGFISTFACINLLSINTNPFK